jgi:hypothetical protein
MRNIRCRLIQLERAGQPRSRGVSTDCRPWPIRIATPVVGLVIAAGLIANDHLSAVVVIPVVVALAAGYTYAAERSGLYISPVGIESRMTRRPGRFCIAWADIDHFEIDSNGIQQVVVVALRDDSRRLLPSTRSRRWDRARVERICRGLEQELAAARGE